LKNCGSFAVLQLFIFFGKFRYIGSRIAGIVPAFRMAILQIKKQCPDIRRNFFGNGSAFKNFQDLSAFFINKFFGGGFIDLKAQCALEQSIFCPVFGIGFIQCGGKFAVTVFPVFKLIIFNSQQPGNIAGGNAVTSQNGGNFCKFPPERFSFILKILVKFGKIELKKLFIYIFVNLNCKKIEKIHCRGLIFQKKVID